MSSLRVIPGDTGQKPMKVGELHTVAFDWDLNGLRAGVQITTSTFTITVVQQAGVGALAKDNPGILTGAVATVVCERTVGDSRVTQVRLDATLATLGDEYVLTNTIVTNETPTQTKIGTISVVIE